ncbi:uncharacterized protein LOC132062086 [Lycium ferocissimum]|uniref:uncharacterized protein LOC132062086 n=1 Tax=Lycium ferocissimum TaxID=112874 RepID=UPI0028151E3F|nr:uncharacterized protein LOC132062086 [Lycium ferocissimum]
MTVFVNIIPVVNKNARTLNGVFATSGFGSSLELFILIFVALVSDGRLGSCSRSGTGARVRRGKCVKGASRLRVGSWNIGTLTGKSIELVKILKKRKINIACVQETKWVGPKAKEVDGYKLWFSGRSKYRNGVGILVDSELRDQVVEVRRVTDRMMSIKVVVEGLTLNIVSAYAPQAGSGEEEKRRFWEDLDELVGGIPPTEKLFVGGDFNWHIGPISEVMMMCMEALASGTGMEEEPHFLDFARAFGLVIANSSFPKKEGTW